MAKEFRLPDLGEGVHEGQIIKLLLNEGDEVREDQPLMEVETDKAAVEIPSPVTGRIGRWHVQEQQIVNVGDVMVTFNLDGESAAPAAATPSKKAAARESAGAHHNGGAATITGTAPAGRRKPASPAVRKLARQMGIDIESVDGSGPGGRITRADVERAAQAGGAPSSSPRSTPSASTASTAAQPAVSTQAIAGAGIVNRVRDLPDGQDDTDQYGPVRRVPVTQARKTIAGVMTQSWTTIPHVTDADDADVTELERLRRQYNAQDRNANQPKLTTLAFVVRAVARALRLYPVFNASFDTEVGEIIYRRYVNIAVGVHTERGLIAPVIRDADQLAIPQIAAALDEIAQKARTASFAVNDTRGGTYTISNAGAFGGSRYSTPIVTPPQVAVLALGRAKMMPWVVDGEIAPRLIVPLSHSFDHRVIDGGEEVSFMQHLISDLEQPGRLVM